MKRTCSTCKHVGSSIYKEPCNICVITGLNGSDGGLYPKWESKEPVNSPIKPVKCLWVVQNSWGLAGMNFKDFEVFEEYANAFEYLEQMRSQDSEYKKLTNDYDYYSEWTMNLYSPVGSRHD